MNLDVRTLRFQIPIAVATKNKIDWIKTPRNSLERLWVLMISMGFNYVHLVWLREFFEKKIAPALPVSY